MGAKAHSRSPKNWKALLRLCWDSTQRPAAKPHFRPRQAGANQLHAPASRGDVQLSDNRQRQWTNGRHHRTWWRLSKSDLDTYFKGLKLNSPSVTAVSVDDGKNTPGSDADGEVMLDIEVVGAVANGAKIAVYFAPNTDQGFVDAIIRCRARHDAEAFRYLDQLGSSGRFVERTITQCDESALQDAATLGVTVTVASGDNGSTDGAGDKKLHVDFPASSPFALACGGTTLNGNGKDHFVRSCMERDRKERRRNRRRRQHRVSAYPATSNPLKFQTTADQFRRPRSPDVAGDADPSTGYQVRVNGQNQVIGGTSAVAPLWAGSVALMNQQIGKPVGFLNPKLYTLGSGVFRDITSGN